LFTLSPVALPPLPPPTGKITATMQQSSRDSLLNRFEVWVDNDTAGTIRPTKVTYHDGRFHSDLPATRLRSVPSQSQRGFPIYQPPQPACASPSKHGTVTVSYDAGGTHSTVTVPVYDETDVVGRYTGQRCLELSVDQVAQLSFSDDVPQDPPGGEGSNGTLTLIARTTGRTGHTLTIDTMTGTPVLSPVGTDVWRPDVTITGDMPTQRIKLPVKPTRCDAHAFAESGGATTFLIGIHLDGKPGQLKILMSTVGARNAIDFAQVDCGFLSSIDGGPSTSPQG
jgi:hypothetical protein